MGVKRIFEIAETPGVQTTEIMLTGGCSRSHVYSQIFADVIGKTLKVSGEMDVASLGMAMAAAYSMGYYSNFAEMTRLVKSRSEYTPDTTNLNYYKEIYNSFKNLYEVLGTEYERLNSIRDKYSNNKETNR